MANGAGPALGLSIGSANLAAVTADHAVTRKPVLTLYRHRPTEVGVPAENPKLDEPGLVVTDFVSRAGSRRAVVSADGSVRRSEALVADGLRALAYAATGGAAPPASVAVAYPAYWESRAVDALGVALSEVPEWSNRARPLTLVPDAAATLFAVRAHPGIPNRGTVAVCDFGGSGTSITLMDAAGDYRALAPTIRHPDFCGDLIDQLLLTAVMGDIASTGSPHAIGSLRRLRTGCRYAKEQLSTDTVATLTGAGTLGDIRVTRAQLDEAIRAALNDFVAVMEKALNRNGIGDLAAVISVGGGANIPAVTTTLSRHFQAPVVTTPRPQLTAAIGAAMRAGRGPGATAATAAAAPVPTTARVALAPKPLPGVTVKARPAGLAAAPARSGTDESRAATVIGQRLDADATSNAGSADPGADPPAAPVRKPIRWYRRPAVAVVPAVVGILLVGMAAAIGLSPADKSTTPAPGASTAPASPTNGATAPTPEAPGTPTTDTNPPATTDTPTTTERAATPQAGAPAAALHEVPPAPPTPVRAQLPPTPARAQLPPVPGVNEPVPGLDRVNRILQDIENGVGLGDLSQLIPH